MVDSGKFWGNIIVFKVIFTQSMNDYNIISMSHTDLAVDITVELECQIRYWVIYETLQEIKIFKMLLNRLSE